MAKILDLTKVMRELAKSIPRAKAVKAASSAEAELCCEICGEFVRHLKLTRDGFFHCQPCEFMDARRRAIQDFDNG